MYDLTNISEEYLKCCMDKSHIYMIENYLKTYDATRRNDVQYLLFPRQKILCQALGSDADVCTEKPRQAGVTTTTAAFMSCEMVLASPDSPVVCLCIGNTLDLAQQMVIKVKEFIMQLPRWFFGADYWSADPDNPKNRKPIFKKCNQKEVELVNNSRIVARSSGPDASRGVGGVTYLIFDEAAFIEKGKDVYASAAATVSTGGHVVMISTPNGKDSLYYDTCRQAKEGTNGFTLVQFRWYQDPRYNRFLEWRGKDENGDIEIIHEEVIDELGNIEYNEAHWESMIQKGYKPYSPWYIRMCKTFNNNKQKIAQELDVSFLGSDSNVIGPEFIEMQRQLNVREPNPDYKDKLLEETWIWKMPIEGHRYIMAIDCSRGDAEDLTSLEIIDVDGEDEDGSPIIEQVLEYNGKLLGDALGEVANNYGLLYNQAFCVVEDIGGYGSATLLCLMALKYPNLYYDDPALKKYTSMDDATSTQVTEKGLPGFHSSSIRFQVLSNFADMIKTNQFKIRSIRVINQLETWIFKNGRIDHKDGCHDDNLTCLAMGLFVLEYSIKSKIKAKKMDIAMLSAIAEINKRVDFSATISIRDNEYHKEKVKGIYVAKDLEIKNKSDYPYMWLLK